MTMDPTSLKKLAAACGGKLLRGDGALEVTTINKDTRTIKAGDLYWALRGENHDGNLYAANAAAKGAAAVLVDDPEILKKLPEGYPAILVENSLRALHRLAGAWRDRLAIRVARKLEF